MFNSAAFNSYVYNGISLANLVYTINTHATSGIALTTIANSTLNVGTMTSRFVIDADGANTLMLK